MKPLAVDLFCGLGGWTEGLLAEGWRVIGVDIERHQYGEHCYPPEAELLLADVLTLDGARFADARLIVASPPCQAYSYRAMPWKRAKALPPPDNSLFESCFRIQREASAVAGRRIPLVVENVQGAQKWVGKADWHYGSFYLWGDVPALMPIPSRRAMKEGIAHRPGGATNFHREYNNGIKAGDRCKDRASGKWTTGWNVANARAYKASQIVQCDGIKGGGGTWFGNYADGIKQGGDWFNASQPFISRRCSSKSNTRKAASAMIAKIPPALSHYIATVFMPPPPLRADTGGKA